VAFKYEVDELLTEKPKKSEPFSFLNIYSVKNKKGAKF